MTIAQRVLAMAPLALAPAAQAAPPEPGANPHSYITVWSPTVPGRGLVFDAVSLKAANRRPAAIDLSDLPDSEIGSIDLIRFRKVVSLRYDPATRELVLHKGP